MLSAATSRYIAPCRLTRVIGTEAAIEAHERRWTDEDDLLRGRARRLQSTETLLQQAKGVAVLVQIQSVLNQSRFVEMRQPNDYTDSLGSESANAKGS